jgi:hypothetical protein
MYGLQNRPLLCAFPTYDLNYNTMQKEKFTPSVPTTNMRATANTLPSNPNKKLLSPGEWARVVLGVEAPFGFDRQPTVLG